MNIPERVDGMGNLTDGELVARVRQGNQEAFSELISRYYGLLQWKISGYRKLGIDADDLLQEAALGLLDSVMSFQEGKGASFETYATVCVNNRLVTPVSYTHLDVYKRQGERYAILSPIIKKGRVKIGGSAL